MAKTDSEESFGPVEVRFAGPWLIPDDQYLGFIRQLFANAQRRCLASLFMVGNAPWRGRDLVLEGLLRALAGACWRGVDARLLIGGERSNATAVQVAALARRRAAELEVPCRWLTAVPGLSGHAKVVICDENVVVGSRSWSEGAPEAPSDSVCVTSASLSLRLGKRFDQQWSAAVIGSGVAA